MIATRPRASNPAVGEWLRTYDSRDPSRHLLGIVEYLQGDEHTAHLEGSIWIDTATVASMAGPLLRYDDDASLGFGWGRLQLETSLVVGDARDLAGRFKNFALDDRRQWWVLTVEPPGGNGSPVATYPDLLGDAVDREVVAIDRVPPSIQRLLEAFAEASDIDDATAHDIDTAMSKPLAQTNPTVGVYDVGQGNCNAICDAAGHPVVYFDFGRPLNFNKRSEPSPWLTFCYTNDPPVVLSHWDFDHWLAARAPANTWLSAAVSRTWIAPRQYMSPNHSRLLNEVVANGKMLLWSHAAGPAHVDFGNGRLALCGGSLAARPLAPNLRNDTGIAMYVMADPWQAGDDAILLPADADFHHVPWQATFSLVGLAATHHGATVSAAPAAAGARKLAYSVGNPNRYSHPTSIAQAVYLAQGWVNSYETRSRASTCHAAHTLGSVLLELVPGTASLPRRCGTCSLCLLQ